MDTLKQIADEALKRGFTVLNCKDTAKYAPKYGDVYGSIHIGKKNDRRITGIYRETVSGNINVVRDYKPSKDFGTCCNYIDGKSEITWEEIMEVYDSPLWVGYGSKRAEEYRDIYQMERMEKVLALEIMEPWSGKVRGYIMGNLDLSGYGKENTIKDLVSIIREEKAEEVKRYGLGEAVKSWIQGVPTGLNVAFATWEQMGLLREWRIPVRDSEEPYHEFYDVITREIIEMNK